MKRELPCLSMCQRMCLPKVTPDFACFCCVKRVDVGRSQIARNGGRVCQVSWLSQLFFFNLLRVW